MVSKEDNSAQPDGVESTEPGLNSGTTIDSAQDEDCTAGSELPVELLRKDASAKRGHPAKFLSVTNFVLVLNCVVITVICVYVMRKLHPEPVNARAETNTTQSVQQPAEQNMLRQADKEAVIAELSENPISWNYAEQLYRQGSYAQALVIYSKLSGNMAGHSLGGRQYLIDLLKLKMAFCLGKMQDSRSVGEFYTSALQSRSPFVRFAANYSLAITENTKGQYLEARTRAYKTLALIAPLRTDLPESTEADCYFLIAEALTRYLLRLNNQSEVLPGTGWSEELASEPAIQADDSQIDILLKKGTDVLSQSLLGPQIQKQANLSIGLRWSAICMDASVDELMTRLASTANVNVLWQERTSLIRNRPVAIDLSGVSEMFIAEVAAGCAGLAARTDEDKIIVFNPSEYENLDEHRKLLTNEAIAVWQRFLLYYRNDRRAVNACFALALLNNMAGQTTVALGQYKMVYTRFSKNPLAPFALLNTSILKTDMKDFDGARKDLAELISQYPDCKVADQAQLYLADATMQAGLYEEAVRAYQRVYNLQLDSRIRQNAAFGLGKCCFQTGQYKQAKEWLTKAVEMFSSPADNRMGPACFMLGKTLIELGENRQACLVLKKALEGEVPLEEYVNIVLYLAQAEAGSENFINALNILESVPYTKLSQEQACRVVISRAGILCRIGLAETAVINLRKQLEIIVDPQQRYLLYLEMAVCHDLTGDLKSARTELAEVLSLANTEPWRQQAQLLLAEVSFKLADYSRAESLCLNILGAGGGNTANQKRVYELLGEIYTQMQQFDKAALAFAGIHDRAGVKTK